MLDNSSVIGINRTQDGSICVLRDQQLICAIQKERLTRLKHDWGKLGDLSNIYKNIPTIDNPVDLVVECYSDDPEIKNLSSYHNEIASVLKFRKKSTIVRISHHLAHLYSAFYPSSFSTAAVMVIDCEGSPVRDFTESYPEQGRDMDGFVEVSSFYYCENNSITCINKQIWDGDWANPVGLGCFYFLLTRTIFPGEGNEGKVMGLASYGRQDALGLPPLVVQDYKVFIPDEWLKIFKEKIKYRYSEELTTFELCANLAAAGQHCFEEALLKLTNWLYLKTKTTNLCFAGGTALNCVANGRLLKESPYRDIFIPPAPHDGGTALGCALYGWISYLGLASSFRWADDFLGPDLSHKDIERDLHEVDGLIVEKPLNIVDAIVNLIESGRVVGLYQGRSEFGPRALGHRSILADPRRQTMRTWINAYVKGRESFRPLAPALLLETVSSIFDINRPSPYMQFAASVRPEYYSCIPSVTHIDGSARIQTVGPHDDPLLYQLLKAFEKKTNIGVLLNTSLNRKGEPIVETISEALLCLQKTKMNALAIPPFLIVHQEEHEIPG